MVSLTGTSSVYRADSLTNKVVSVLMTQAMFVERSGRPQNFALLRPTLPGGDVSPDPEIQAITGSEACNSKTWCLLTTYALWDSVGDAEALRG